MARQSQKRDQIWAALENGEALTSQAIATRTGITLGHVCNELGVFHRAGLVRRVGTEFRRTRGRPWGIWQMAPAWVGRRRPVALKALQRQVSAQGQARTPAQAIADQQRAAADAIERAIARNLEAIRRRRPAS